MFKKLKAGASRLRHEVRAYRLIATDARTPRVARWLLVVALGYILLPFDIIPDWIPVIGCLDDLVIVPLLILMAMRLVPKQVVKECRERAGLLTP